MFEFNPELVQGDDEEADDTMVYEREADEVALQSLSFSDWLFNVSLLIFFVMTFSMF